MEQTLKDLIVEKAKEGKVVFMTIEGPMITDLEAFISQPAEGLLYDLNRDRATVLTFINDPKWVNDFAVSLVIEKLKNDLEAAKEDLAKSTEALRAVRAELNALIKAAGAA